MRRRIDDRNTRKISKRGASYSVTIPIEMMRKLGWKNKQKVIFKQSGNKLIIEDWE
jgi:antitoxin component of MazEF toxin-antitoxin module